MRHSTDAMEAEYTNAIKEKIQDLVNRTSQLRGYL
jgi:hypothetical protein